MCAPLHRRFSAEELQRIQDAFMQAAPKQGAALDLEHLKVWGWCIFCWDSQ